MSVEAIAVVLHHSRARGTARLVLVGIANHEGDGGSYPSIETLAKYAAVDERNVQRAVAKLVELGEVEVYRQEGGDRWHRDDRRPNLYRVLVRCPSDCDRTTAHRTPEQQKLAVARRQDAERRRGAVDNPPSRGDATAVPSSSRGGATAVDGVAVAPPKPPTEPSETRGAVGLSTTDRARGAQPVETDGQRIARENRERREARERARASDEVVRARAAEVRAALAAARERRAGSSS